MAPSGKAGVNVQLESVLFDMSSKLVDLSTPSDLSLRPSGLGTCGVYFISDNSGTPVAVFKPACEEHVPEDLKDVLAVGEGYARERAAYIVSEQLGGLWSVPKTVVCTVKHGIFGERTGSLQRFAADAVDMSDLGPSGIVAQEIHKIGMLDLMMFNLDRHEGNVLMKENKELVPIDHGLALPKLLSREQGPNLEVVQNLAFVWQSWPQSKIPFDLVFRRALLSLSPEKVSSLAEAIAEDMPMINTQLLTMKVGAVVLRKSATLGLSLHDIAGAMGNGLGSVMQRVWEGVRKQSEGKSHSEWETLMLSDLENEWVAYLEEIMPGQLVDISADVQDDCDKLGCIGDAGEKITEGEERVPVQPGGPKAIVDGSSHIQDEEVCVDAGARLEEQYFLSSSSMSRSSSMSGSMEELVLDQEQAAKQQAPNHHHYVGVYARCGHHHSMVRGGGRSTRDRSSRPTCGGFMVTPKHLPGVQVSQLRA